MTTALWLAIALAFSQEREGTSVPAAARTVDRQVAQEAAAISEAVAAWAGAEKRLKLTEAAGGRLRLWSDFSAGEVREAVKRSEGLLARLDRPFGAPEQLEEARPDHSVAHNLVHL